MFANKTSFKSLLDAFSQALEYEVTLYYLELEEYKKGPQKLRFDSRKNLACYIFFGQTRAEIEQFFHGTPNGFIGVKFYVFKDGSLCIFNKALQQLKQMMAHKLSLPVVTLVSTLIWRVLQRVRRI